MNDSTDNDTEQLARRLKALRTARKLSMRELASRSGLSAGYLSQIENGKANVTVQSLRKLAAVFGIAWSDFFVRADEGGAVLRRADRRRLAFGSGQRDYGIARLPLIDVDVSVSEYEPGVTVGDEEYVHDDLHEIFVVVRGTIRFRLEGVDHDLEPGDSVDFRSSTPHMLTNTGDELAEGLWVICPPAGSSTPHDAS